MTIGERIRRYRKYAGLTQKELGLRSDIAEPTIRKYESNRLNPKKETLQKIAKALDVDIYTLDPTLSDHGFKLDSLPKELRDEIEKIAGGDLAIAEALACYYFLSSETKGSIENQVDQMIEQLQRASKESIKSSDRQTEIIKKRLDVAFNQLSPKGKMVAVERVEELAENPRYQKQGHKIVVEENLSDE